MESELSLRCHAGGLLAGHGYVTAGVSANLYPEEGFRSAARVSQRSGSAHVPVSAGMTAASWASALSWAWCRGRTRRLTGGRRVTYPSRPRARWAWRPRAHRRRAHSRASLPSSGTPLASSIAMSPRTTTRVGADSPRRRFCRRGSPVAQQDGGGRQPDRCSQSPVLKAARSGSRAGFANVPTSSRLTSWAAPSSSSTTTQGWTSKPRRSDQIADRITASSRTAIRGAQTRRGYLPSMSGGPVSTWVKKARTTVRVAVAEMTRSDPPRGSE